MRTLIALALATLAVFLSACHTPPPTALPPAPRTTTDLKVWSQQQGEAQPVNITNDQVYHKAKRYVAWPLTNLFAELGAGVDLDRTVLVFRCEDGYAPAYFLSELTNGVPYLARRDLDAPAGEDWIYVTEADNDQYSPAPFMLVWEAAADVKLPWPYQLTKIERVPAIEHFGAAYPPRGSAEAGFHVFRKNCMNCHSINNVGGEVGPELNLPVNVTEYWKPEILKQFIHTPISVRQRTKMPTPAPVSDADLDLLLEYLKTMARNKKPAVTKP